LFAVSVAAPVPPLATGSVPVALVAKLRPVVLPVPPEATGKGWANVVTKPVLIESAVEPLDCNANTPLVSAVDFRPDVPDTTPLSELIVLAMCYPSALIFAVRACNSASSCSLVGAVTVIGAGSGGSVNTPSA